MKITKEGRFAVRGVLDLAQQLKKETGPVKSDEIAGRINISKIFLNKIFHRLLKNGVVESVRGRNGGYILAKSPQELTLYDVLLASGENLRPVLCDDNNGQHDFCENKDICSVSPVWDLLARKIEVILSAITLDDVLENKSYSKLKSTGLM